METLLFGGKGVNTFYVLRSFLSQGETIPKSSRFVSFPTQKSSLNGNGSQIKGENRRIHLAAES